MKFSLFLTCSCRDLRCMLKSWCCKLKAKHGTQVLAIWHCGGREESTTIRSNRIPNLLIFHNSAPLDPLRDPSAILHSLLRYLENLGNWIMYFSPNFKRLRYSSFDSFQASPVAIRQPDQSDLRVSMPPRCPLCREIIKLRSF